MGEVVGQECSPMTTQGQAYVCVPACLLVCLSVCLSGAGVAGKPFRRDPCSADLLVLG